MARSTYIYCVFDRCGFIMPFTVKHECKSWIEKNKKTVLEDGYVVSYLDGLESGSKKYWSAEEFIEDTK